jgi:hypothetical protein
MALNRVSTMHAICTTHLVVLDLIILNDILWDENDELAEAV